MWKRTLSLISLAVAVLLVTAACAKTPGVSSADTLAQEDHTTEQASTVEASGNHGRVVEVELTEFAIVADSFDLIPGETVEFLITNSGVVQHEFRLSNQDRVDGHIAGGHDDHDEGAMSDEEMEAMETEDGDHETEETSHDDDAAHHETEEADHDDDAAHHAEGAMSDEEIETKESDHDGEDADHGAGADDIVLVLAAGETGTLIFTVPDDDLDYTAAVCLIPGHYEAGMATELSYQA